MRKARLKERGDLGIEISRELHFHVLVTPEDTKIDEIIRESEKEHRELLGLKELLEKAKWN